MRHPAAPAGSADGAGSAGRAGEAEDGAPPSRARIGAVALAAAVVGLCVGVSLVAFPLFALAAFAEPGQGLARPFVRTGLTRVALPVGVAFGIFAGVLAGRWAAAGGRLPAPAPHEDFYERR